MNRLVLMSLLAASYVFLLENKTKSSEPPPEPTGVAARRQEAKDLEPFAKSELAKQFLAATADLPTVAPRIAYRDETTREWFSKAAADRLDPERRAKLTEKTLDEEFYYTTKYGTPLAYVRPIDILAANGVKDVSGKRILDYGYGIIGHLRLLASLGADVVGVEVDTLQPALYNDPSDQGTIKGRSAREGRITLVHGRWPAESAAKTAVGGGYDIIISKNTLKRGYIHPEKPVDKRMLVDMGVDDETFVREVYAALKPGGLFFIYNLSPAPAPPDKPYIPWADGRSPFEKSLYESAGFKVIAFDQDDTPAAREMGKILGWDKGEDGMNLENDLFGTYTLLRKP